MIDRLCGKTNKNNREDLLFVWILFLYLSLVNKSNIENLKQNRNSKRDMCFVSFSLKNIF